MTYFNKNKELKRGYNAYIDESTNYMGTLMNVGLLVMEDGDTYTYESADREVAILLFEGKVTYEYAGKTVEADRPNCFHHEAYCLLAPKGTKITLTAHSHSELYMHADEATGNLDTRTSFEILVLFQKLHAEGRTIIFVTHNPEIAQYSSRNITLRDGHVTSDTVNRNILNAAEALARLPKNDD